MGTTADVSTALEHAFASAGVEGFLYAFNIDTGAALDYGGHELCASASTAKVAILVAVMRAIADGQHTLDQRVHIPAGGRTGGPTGLSVMAHEADLSLRDVCLLMIGMSDNHATDILLDLLPPGRVTETARALGLARTTVEGTIRDMYARAARRAAGITSFEELAALLRTDPDILPATAPWRTTPYEMAQLFARIWRDEAAPPDLCDEMRTLLRCCATTNGLTAGFPMDVREAIGHKTGTLAGVRNEAGIVEYPDGGRYAIGVYTRGDPGDPMQSEIQAGRAIAAAAGAAVAHLRATRVGAQLT